MRRGEFRYLSEPRPNLTHYQTKELQNLVTWPNALAYRKANPIPTQCVTFNKLENLILKAESSSISKSTNLAQKIKKVTKLQILGDRGRTSKMHLLEMCILQHPSSLKCGASKSPTLLLCGRELANNIRCVETNVKRVRGICPSLGWYLFGFH